MPKYQLLPALSDDELAALREDIQANGVRVPIDVDEEGEILDGHHRKAVAIMLGIDCPERVVRGLAEFEKVDYALTVNMARRHLGREERRELVKKSLMRDAGLADREHARRCGVHHDTVGRIRADLEILGKLKPAARRVGADGKERQLADSASSKPSGPSPTSPGAGSGENPPAGPPSTPDASEETDRTGVDQPESDHRDAPGEAAEDAPLAAGSAGGSADSPGSADERERQEAAAGVSVPAAPVSDEDDDEKRVLDWRRGVSRDFMQALVDAHLRLQPDPLAWLETTYLPGSYPDRNMPRVRECFTPAAIRVTGQYLLMIADYLERNEIEL